MTTAYQNLEILVDEMQHSTYQPDELRATSLPQFTFQLSPIFVSLNMSPIPALPNQVMASPFICPSIIPYLLLIPPFFSPILIAQDPPLTSPISSPPILQPLFQPSIPSPSQIPLPSPPISQFQPQIPPSPTPLYLPLPPIPQSPPQIPPTPIPVPVPAPITLPPSPTPITLTPSPAPTPHNRMKKRKHKLKHVHKNHAPAPAPIKHLNSPPAPPTDSSLDDTTPAPAPDSNGGVLPREGIGRHGMSVKNGLVVALLIAALGFSC